MSIKKNLLALAVMAVSLMGLAPSAMAVDGKVVHDTTLTDIPANRVLHLVGWTKFSTARASYTCHLTSELKTVTATTFSVTQFTVPDTTKCTGTGLLAGCTLSGHQTTNLPYHVTVTPPAGNVAGDFDVTGTIVIHKQFSGFLCPVDITLTYSSITLKTLNTESKRTVTGTLNRLGNTITSSNEQTIAGVEISGTGVAHGPFGEEASTTTGELELTDADRCTWRIVTDP